MLATALNHMAAPRLGAEAFLRLAQRLGCVGVEFRTDLPGALFGGLTPGAVAELARARDLRILTLSELTAFDDWSEARAARAAAVIDIARACGAEAISLIPCNDRRKGADLPAALRGLSPMLADAGLTGLIEPLGFATSSLRSKAEAVAAIKATGTSAQFKLIHDSFHHALAGGGPVFAAYTGLVHISGVTADLVASAVTDAHRGLVDRWDRLGTLAQLDSLAADGYCGPISMEPFSPVIHALADPGPALHASFDFIHSRLGQAAA